MKRLILLSILCLFTYSAHAQLTFTYNDYIALVGKSTVRTAFESTDQTAVNSMIAITGAGQVWNLSGVSFTETGTSTTQVLAGTSGVPGAEDPAFSGATHHMRTRFIGGSKDSTTYAFLNLMPDSLMLLGNVEDSNGMAGIKTYIAPPMKQAQFPLQMGTTWSGSASLSTSEDPGFQVPVEYSALVDGSGTLNLPGGENVNVLRVKRTLVISGFITTTTYSFMSKDDLEVATITPPQVTPFGTFPGTITYYSAGTGGVGKESNGTFTLMQSTPNPAVTETTIPYTLHKNAHVKIVLHDQLGMEVTTVVDAFVTAGSQNATVDVRGIPSGVYYYTISAEGQSITFPMTVTK